MGGGPGEVSGQEFLFSYFSGARISGVPFSRAK